MPAGYRHRLRMIDGRRFGPRPRWVFSASNRGPANGLIGISSGELVEVNALDDGSVTQLSLMSAGWVWAQMPKRLTGSCSHIVVSLPARRHACSRSYRRGWQQQDCFEQW